MRELTQTAVGTVGNCWQTCIACILDLDPNTLPDQTLYDWRRPGEDGKTIYGPSYSNALNGYLRKHHGLAYTEIYDFQFVALTIKEPGIHLLAGPTVRTADNGMQHVVVARHGEMIWDPHPSRVGLLKGERIGLLVPFPQQWERTHDEFCKCQCPTCGPIEPS